jgi:hypothetical protein
MITCPFQVGLDLRPGEAVISLGTSDTLLTLLPRNLVEEGKFKTVLPFGHIFPHPELKDR